MTTNPYLEEAIARTPRAILSLMDALQSIPIDDLNRTPLPVLQELSCASDALYKNCDAVMAGIVERAAMHRQRKAAALDAAGDTA